MRECRKEVYCVALGYARGPDWGKGRGTFLTLPRPGYECLSWELSY